MVLATAFFVAAVAISLVHYGYFGDSIMDDAFFFVRYGNNFLDTGVFAWNRGEGPVYGNTSQLYQLLVTLVHWLTSRNVILTPSLAAALGALAYLVALPWTYVVSPPAGRREAAFHGLCLSGRPDRLRWPALPAAGHRHGNHLGGFLLFAGLALVTAYKIVPTAARVVGSHLPALESDAAINTKDGALTHVAHNFPFFRGRMVQMVQALGDDCSIAVTEDGLLSAYARHNRIVDYSGLHDRAIVREGSSADRLLLVSKPDVLTMPPG